MSLATARPEAKQIQPRKQRGQLIANALLAACAIAAVTTLTACGAGPTRPDTGMGHSAVIEQLSSEEISAIATVSQAQAREFMTLASTAETPQRALDFYLRAADSFLLSGDIKAARAQLSRAKTYPLGPVEKTRAEMLTQRMSNAVPNLAGEQLPNNDYSLLTARLSGLAADLANSGEHGASVRVRTLMQTLLSNPADKVSNQRGIWASLQQIDRAALGALPPAALDSMIGWWSLAFIAKEEAADNRRDGLSWWQQHYPSHNANQTILPKLLADIGPNTRISDGAFVDSSAPSDFSAPLAQLPENPAKVALLLPMSGRYAKAATAIEAGYRWADTERSTISRSVVTIDTGGTAKGAWAAYQKAVDQGAEMAIGPLKKGAVGELAQNVLPIPVLALNSAGDASNSAMVRFGLLPENEASEVARRAYQDGKRNVAILYPENRWGERVADGFSRTFERLGANVLARGTYEPNSSTLGHSVRALLKSNRKNALWRDYRSFKSANSGADGSVGGGQARTQIDMIFIAAFPRDARILRPSLKFHHAIRLPVYMTSHAYSGRLNPKFDNDLNGVIFCDMPVVLNSASQDGVARVPASYRRYPKRLLALGHDARLLIDDLATMQKRGYYELSGRTGDLKLNNDKIERRLECAKFEEGVPVPLPNRQPDIPAIQQPGTEPAQPLQETRLLQNSLAGKLARSESVTNAPPPPTISENLAF